MLKPVKIFFLFLLFPIFSCKPLYHPQESNPPEENTSQKLKVRVLTQDRSYALGGPVDLKLEIENISQDVVRLNFDSNQIFDFKIYRKGWEIWRWSYNKTFDQTEIVLSIYPGEVWTFQAEWDTKDNQKRWVSGGRYYIEGILNCSPALKSEQVQIGLAD